MKFYLVLCLYMIVKAEGQRPFCLTHQSTCSNGQCISKEAVCDGRRDCSDGSDESMCGSGPGCEPNEYQCQNGRCVLKTWVCDSDDDCGDGSDENTCNVNPPGSPCQYKEWMCHSRKQCIPKSFHCDGEVDCQDTSDEIGCSPPKIVESPPPRININQNEAFLINCTAVGIPPPEIVWRLNWGHVPQKCSMTSIPDVQMNRAFGEIVCPSASLKDQGAYSCEAINAKGTCFAGSRGCGTPGQDAIVFVHDPNNENSGGCPPGLIINKSGECARPDTESGGEISNCPPGHYFDNNQCFPCNCLSDINGNPTDCYIEQDGTPTCICPTGYQGKRCESCQSGYVSSGLQCVPKLRDNPPKVSIEPNYLDVYEGQPANFFCQVADGGEPKWTQGTYEPVDGFVSGGTLSFDSVSMDQNGQQFYCTASNEAGTDSKRAILYVRPRTNIPRTTLKPMITSRPSDNLIYQQTPEVFAGQELLLSCSPNNPSHLVRWDKNGGLPYGTDPNHKNLRIPNIQPEDSGTFECSVIDPYNGETIRQSNVHVNVIPSNAPAQSEGNPVSIYPERQHVESGSTAFINCNVGGVSNPNIKWTKDDGEIIIPNSKYYISGRSLTINDVSIGDRGVYTCTLHPDGQRASVVIDVEENEYPVIEIYPSHNQTIVKEGSALFQCRAIKGVPPPTIKWEAVNGYPLPSNVEILPGGVIRFNQVEGSEAGEYKCTASNSKDSITEVVNLKIIEPPRITLNPERSVQKVKGEPFKLSCSAEGNPEPTYSLRKIGTRDNSYGSSEPVMGARETPEGLEYVIDSIDFEHEGAYICKATNEAGEMEEIMQLIVLEDDMYYNTDYPENDPRNRYPGSRPSSPSYDPPQSNNERMNYNPDYPENDPRSRYPGNRPSSTSYDSAQSNNERMNYNPDYPENDPRNRYPPSRPTSPNYDSSQSNNENMNYNTDYPENDPRNRYPPSRPFPPSYDSAQSNNERMNYNPDYPENDPRSRYPGNRPSSPSYDSAQSNNDRMNYNPDYPENDPRNRYPQSRPSLPNYDSAQSNNDRMNYNPDYPENDPRSRYPGNRPSPPSYDPRNDEHMNYDPDYPENDPRNRYPQSRPSSPSYDPRNNEHMNYDADHSTSENDPGNRYQTNRPSYPGYDSNNDPRNEHYPGYNDRYPNYNSDNMNDTTDNDQYDSRHQEINPESPSFENEYEDNNVEATPPSIPENDHFDQQNSRGPSVLLTPNYQVVNVGDFARINCSTPNDPNSDKTWSKVGYNSLSPNVEIYPNGILNFRDISSINEGKYVCTADGHLGRSMGTAEVVVQGDKITITWLENLIYNEDGGAGSSLSHHDINKDLDENNNSERRSHKLGETFSIDCRLPRDNNNIPEWSKDESPLREKIQRIGRVIRVPEAQIEDAGLYVCNLNGQVLSFMVDITEEDPEVTSLDYETDCPPYTFQCDNNKGCIDMVYKCDGEFDCTDGSDEIKCEYTTMSSDLSNLKIVTNFETVVPEEGFEFECIDKLNRNEDPKWMKKDGFFERNVFQEGHKLKFLNYTPDNIGSYVCSIGEDQSTYEFLGN